MPVDAEFWQREAEKLMDVMRPWMEEAAKKGIDEGLELLGEEAIGLNIDFSLVNNYARAWAVVNTADVVAKITSTSMDAFTEKFPGWVEAGGTLDELIAQLTPHYGPWRAEMIAVTETTRAYAKGNEVMWGASGVVDGKQWNTAEDELVCEICGPLANQETTLEGVYSDGTTSPPAHVRCRCWEHPVVKGKVPVADEVSPTQMEIPESFTDWRQASDWANRRWPNVKWALNGVPSDQCRSIIQEYEKLERKYPKVASSKRLKSIKVQTLKNEHWYAQYDPKARRITLNRKFYGQPQAELTKSFQNDIHEKWHPFGFSPAADGDAIFTHEFGHGLYYRMIGGFEESAASKDVVEFLKKFEAAPFGNLGRYSATNIKEKFAEAFSQMEYVDPANWAPPTKLLHDFLQTKHMMSIMGTSK